MKPAAPRVFGSRVAWRVFVLFAIVGMLPVAAIGLLAQHQFGLALSDVTDRQLGDSSRGYGQMVFRRLRIAGRALEQIPATADSLDYRLGAFDAVAVSSDGDLRSLFGELRQDELQDMPDLTDGRASLWLREDAAGPDLYLAQRSDAGPALVGRLSGAYLWDDFTLPADQAVCAFSIGTEQPLYCSATLADAERQRLASRACRPAAGRDGRATGTSIGHPSGSSSLHRASRVRRGAS